MNSYEAKQEARRQRYEERAERATKRAAQNFDRAGLREEKSGIPFGQPILVGHHSEGRHRRAIERADNAMRRGIEESDKAAYYRGKAASVGMGGISSGDPEALDKLREKVAKAEEIQTVMREANKIIRKYHKRGCTAPDHPQWGEYAAELGQVADHLKSCSAYLMKPDFAGRVGFADYQLTNNNANIRRMKDRIAQLERASEAEHKETEFQGIVRVVENVEENRVQLFFPGKPDADVRANLKSHGFRWSRLHGAWQRHLNNAGRWAADCIVKDLTA